MNNEYKSNTLSPYYIPYDDNCNECNQYTSINCCNKCSECVCSSESCSTIYPHYNNTYFIICKACFCDIEQQLHVQIDFNKLRTLKQRINDNKVIKRPKKRVV